MLFPSLRLVYRSILRSDNSSDRVSLDLAALKCFGKNECRNNQDGESASTIFWERFQVRSSIGPDIQRSYRILVERMESPFDCDLVLWAPRLELL